MNRLIAQHGLEDILLAIPSASRRRASKFESLRELPVHIRTLPSFIDIAKGSISVGDLRELDIEDLLGRASIRPRPASSPPRDRQGVMVSGAGGSIAANCAARFDLAHNSLPIDPPAPDTITTLPVT